MAHCPVCNMDVDDEKMDEHKKMHMEKGNMGGMAGHSADDGHDHGSM